MSEVLPTETSVDLSGLTAAAQKACDVIDVLRARNAAALAIIERYAAHDSSCASVHPARCSCGFEKAMQAMEDIL